MSRSVIARKGRLVYLTVGMLNSHSLLIFLSPCATLTQKWALPSFRRLSAFTRAVYLMPLPGCIDSTCMFGEIMMWRLPDASTTVGTTS